jgi:1,4-alpha-glucan branching enzyme
MFTHFGSKLLFMGNEIGQLAEWNVGQSIDWHLLESKDHMGIKELVKSLNFLYRNEPALHEKNFTFEGFEWIDGGDAEQSILVYSRKGTNPEDELVIVLNMTPVARNEYRLGVPAKGNWNVIFNSDDHDFAGSEFLKNRSLKSQELSWMNKEYSVAVELPPLAGIILKREAPKETKATVKKAVEAIETIVEVLTEPVKKSRKTKKPSL